MGQVNGGFYQHHLNLKKQLTLLVIMNVASIRMFEGAPGIEHASVFKGSVLDDCDRGYHYREGEHTMHTG